MKLEFTQLFLEGINHNELERLYSMLQSFGADKVWLMGGQVYRTIASRLYGTPMPPVDYDFLTLPETSIVVPEGWSMITNRQGCPKLLHGALSVDVAPLSKINYIQNNGLSPTVENYLKGTPFTVQSIVYSFEEQRVIGNVGIWAIENRTVAINNLDSAQYNAEKKGMSLRESLEEKARSLGFTVNLQNVE